MTEELDPLETIQPDSAAEQADEVEAEGEDSLSTDRFDYDRAMVTLTITLFPNDSHEHGRMVGVSVRSVGEPPLIASPVRESHLELPEGLKLLLEQYRLQLPQREGEYKKQVEQEKVEQARREQEQADNKAKKSAKAVNTRPDSVRVRSKKVVDDSQTIQSKGLFD